MTLLWVGARRASASRAASPLRRPRIRPRGARPMLPSDLLRRPMHRGLALHEPPARRVLRTRSAQARVTEVGAATPHSFDVPSNCEALPRAAYDYPA